MRGINTGTRIINYLIDMVAVISISIIPMLIFGSLIGETLTFILIWMAYYFFFEFFTQRTLGKIITNTTVIDLKNEKPTAKRVFLRTILRLNPFDGISYLFGKVQGMHDVLSNTRLVEKKKNDT